MRKILHLVIIAIAIIFMICVAGCVGNNSPSTEIPSAPSPSTPIPSTPIPSTPIPSTTYSPIGYWEGHPIDGFTWTLDIKSLSNGTYSMNFPRSEMTAEYAGLDALGYSGDIKTMNANVYLEKQDKNTYSVVQTSVQVLFYNGQELSYNIQSQEEANTLGYFDLYSDTLMRLYLKRGGDFILNKVEKITTPPPTPAEAIKLLGEWKGNSAGVTLSLNFVSNTEGYMKYVYPDKTILVTDILGDNTGLTGYLKTIGTTIELTKLGNNMYSISQKDMYVDTYSGTTLTIPRSAGMDANGGHITVLSSTKMRFTDDESGISLDLTK